MNINLVEGAAFPTADSNGLQQPRPLPQRQRQEQRPDRPRPLEEPDPRPRQHQVALVNLRGVAGFAEMSNYDGLGLAALVRGGDVAPLDLVEEVIARIERTTRGSARSSRRCTTRPAATRRGPLPDGPFRGVPFLMKDLLAAYAGVPLRSGSRFYATTSPRPTARSSAATSAAGLIAVGKTATPELGVPHTSRPPPTATPTTRGTHPHHRRLERRLGRGRRRPRRPLRDRRRRRRIDPHPRRLLRRLRPQADPRPHPLRPRPQRAVAGRRRPARAHPLRPRLRRPARRDRRPRPRRPHHPARPPPARSSPRSRPEPGKLRIAFTTRPLLGGAVDPACVTAVARAVRLLELARPRPSSRPPPTSTPPPSRAPSSR
jgi:amidase